MDQRADQKASNSFIVSLDLRFVHLLGNWLFGWVTCFLGESLGVPQAAFPGFNPIFLVAKLLPLHWDPHEWCPPDPWDISIFNLQIPCGFVPGVISGAGRQPFPFPAAISLGESCSHSPAPGAKEVLLLYPT